MEDFTQRSLRDKDHKEGIRGLCPLAYREASR